MPLEITFRDFPSTPALEAHVRERAAKLEHFARGIVRCHVTVEAPHRRSQHGDRYHVRIDLGLADGDLHVSRDHGANGALEDAYAAIDDAFKRAERQVAEHGNKRREGRHG